MCSWMKNIKPFFINSNLCMKDDDIKTFDDFMNTTAGNVGNSYISYSLIKTIYGKLVNLPQIKSVYTYDFNNQDEDIDIINNECNCCFLVLQDQIRNTESYGNQIPYQKLENFIKKINKPVIVAGLGTNYFCEYDFGFYKKLKKELVDFLKFLSDHCIEIGVRGHITEEILNKLKIKNVRTIGCPSFFEQGENRIIKKEKHLDFSKFFFNSTGIFNNLNCPVILQDFYESSLIKPVCYNRWDVSLGENEINNLYSKKYHIFSKIEDWKNFIKNYSFGAGNRLHGTIISLNSGVPAVCTNNDIRAFEMCRFLKIPYNKNFSFENKETITKEFDMLNLEELNNAYPKLYKNYKDFLSKNNINLCEGETVQNEVSQPSIELYPKDFTNNLNTYSICLKTDEIIRKKTHLRFSKKLFSIREEENKMVLRLFGIKFKFKKKNLTSF